MTNQGKPYMSLFPNTFPERMRSKLPISRAIVHPKVKVKPKGVDRVN